MIVFKTSDWSWDVTNYGLDFTEESPYFEDVITKNFSFPINVELNQDTSYKLGLINVRGITDYDRKIYGTLIIDNEFYDAYIAINNIKGNNAEITFFYGKATLTLFDKKLKELPFDITLVPNNNLRGFAKSQLNQEWPQVTHQFVSVFRDDIASKSNYKDFSGWVNHMLTSTLQFEENESRVIDGKTVAINRNVMSPMTYMLEVLKVAFKTEGLDVRGDLINDDFFKKVLLVPKKIMEQFAVTQYDNYSFSEYTQQEQSGASTINAYQRIHTPQDVGSYSLKIKINMSPVMARFFKLEVVQDNEVLFSKTSRNTNVNINETLDINIVDTNVFNDIVVTMKLFQQGNEIAAFNNFTYEHKEGQLNIFPNIYTLADYMPDMTFRKFFNQIKSWLNLDAVYTENAVYLNFLENEIDNFRFINRTHLEQPDEERAQNENNLFKLKYKDGEEIYIGKDGQIFDDSDFTEDETEKLEFKILPLSVTDNFRKVTAVYPEDEQDLMLVLFDGPVAGENLAVKTINNRSLSIQDTYNFLWKRWLMFRANAETVTDSFYMHFTEAINIRDGEYKYNTKRLILKLRKQRVTTEWYKVEVTAETF